jgi:diguanylate cyclase (GGDEF)-like protein/putative nucleotidyltransferase with HDIG domain
MDPGAPSATPGAAVQALRLTAAAATGAADVDAFLRSAAAHMAQLLGADRCSILLVDRGHFRTVASVGLSDRFCTFVDGLPITPTTGSCGPAVSSGHTSISPDLREDPNWAIARELIDAEGLRACWSVPLVLAGGEVAGSLGIYGDTPGAPEPEQVEAAETLASIVALGLDGLRHQQELSASRHATIRALTSALDARDAYTRDHSTATGDLAATVARRLGMDPAAVDEVERVALLHDIGKIAVPNEILNSPDPLTPAQQAVMRTHPEVGERILRHVPDLEDVASAVRHEHERWDGGGYPDGLAGTQIPIASRIVFACDAYHAMTSDRPYRAAMDRDSAVAELRANAGTQFDPAVVQALLDALGEAGAAVAGPVEAEERARDDALAAIARALGADDVLVFRRVCGELFSHVGGFGRGQGWAGNIELDAATEPRLLASVRDQMTRSFALPATGRIVGPYFGRSALVAPCGPDTVVVFGSATDALRDACTSEAGELARRAAEMLDEVPAAKRLADELEVLDAVRAVTTVAADNVHATMTAIAGHAADALSCEFAALVLDVDGEQRVVRVDRGWQPSGEAFDAALLALAGSLDRDPRVIQDADDACRVLQAPGAASVAAVPVGDIATLVAVHAEPVMRGFTSLCRRVAGAIADAGESVLRRALAQERLARENAALSLRVRTDALTGVASRAAWDELVLAEELHRSRSGVTVSVAVFDVDGLKRVNDGEGHLAGDELLRTCGQVLLDCSRVTDAVARLGGDEFAVLLRYCGEDSAGAWCDRVDRALAARGVAMTGGWAQAGGGVTIADAYAKADRRLCASKAARRDA